MNKSKLRKIINTITKIIRSHMSHWIPTKNTPLPKTELERIFALADYVMNQKDIEWNIKC